MKDFVALALVMHVTKLHARCNSINVTGTTLFAMGSVHTATASHSRLILRLAAAISQVLPLNMSTVKLSEVGLTLQLSAADPLF